MSDHHSIERPAGEHLRWQDLGRWPQRLLGAGLALLALSASFWFLFGPARFAYSWLVGFFFVFTLAAGCLFWMLLHYAIDANWSVVVRRLMENVASLFFPWVPLLFLPLIVAIETGWLFQWWNIPLGDDVVLDAKRWYLNHDFFRLRFVLYFTYFAVVVWLLKKWSVRQDQSGKPEITLWCRKLAYGGIIGFGLSISFAAVDWLMGLNHHWFSTMWGVYIFSGAAGASMALLILIANALHSAGYLRGVFTVEHNHIMGKLLFAFTVFWAYIAFSQYMLYYYANIPEETVFFHHRNTGSWWLVSILLVAFRFFFPFLMLLTQPAKRTPGRLCFASGWILLWHFVDLYWIIIPQYQIFKAVTAGVHDDVYADYLNFSPVDFLVDLVPVAGMVAVLAYFFLRRLSQHSLFPHRDPRLYESVTLIN